jgi:acetylornithine deacetylase/succinyl-diaminopimelate desuccinylase-like protein
VVLAILSDEEQGGEYGSRYLVENHAAMFEGIRYALGEFGGFTFYIGKKIFYPIMVAEKRPSRLRARVRGPGGHAALPFHGGATARLGHLLQQLDKGHLPSHVTSVTHHMITTLASALQFPANLLLRLLLNPRCNDPILRLLGNKGKDFEPLFHNTVNVTVLHGGEQTSVIPSEITVDLIAHLLPGYSPEDLISELRPVIGDDVEIEVIHYDPGPSEPDMGLFDTLADVLCEADPHGIPVPLLLPSSTDGRVFSRMGIQTYGFLPMNLPPELNFSQTIHAADERIPVEALGFGTQAIYKVLQRFGNK